MLRTFNFVSQDETFDNIVSCAIGHVKSNFENKLPENYQEEVKTLNASIMKYCLADTRYADKYAENPLAAAKDPSVQKNQMFKENFNAVIAQIINAAVPTVSTPLYEQLFAEVVQVGFGDSARFIVTSNDLFKVNQLAEGVNRGVLQPMYDDEYTVNCAPIEIATGINWYQVAAGQFDWGQFGLKAAKSFQGYIYLKIIGAMTSAVTANGSAYAASGIDTANWSNLAARVSSANGGAQVYAVGTINALNKAFPATAGLQYGLGQEITKNGYLDRYLGVPLMGMDNVLVPGTVNAAATLAIPTDKIYMVAADAYKPVKVVFEGDTVSVEQDPSISADRTYGIKIEMRVGVSAIVGSKFGTITLA